MLRYLKHIIKKYFQVLWLRQRYAPAVQIGQRALFHTYKTSDSISLAETGFRVFSQFEEDGKLLFIFSKIGVKHESFIEIGSDDGLNSNCANLALNFQWHGVFMDANPLSISRGQYFYKRYPHPYGYKPKFICAKITRENINDLIRQAGYSGQVDLLSIDIDGNDYWIWDAITAVRPRVVVIETHIDFGMRDIVVPYNPDYAFPGVHPQYHGASAVAMVKLGKKKGYRLIGANTLGFNFIFLADEENHPHLPEVTVESLLTHPSCFSQPIDPEVLRMKFEQPLN